MKRAFLLNSPDECVDEALKGLVQLSQGRLCLAKSRIVVRSGFDKTKVALISLGGSGHEPAHAGYVGHGMLTAAVAGNVFASPPPSDILDCLIQVTGAGGALLIVKNYTGDIVNAGIAKEQAEREYGLKVAMVVCDDDCATKGSGGAGARGLAGTLFMHKIAGAMAESGKDLEEIVNVIDKIRPRIATLGLSFSSCTLPGQTQATRPVDPNKAELGLGIHGESGVKVMEVAPTSKEAAEILVHETTKDCSQGIGVIINNLGALSHLEMLVFSNDVLNAFKARSLSVQFVAMGTFMTSLDSAGVSLSILKHINEDEIQWLQAGTDAIGWTLASNPISSSLRAEALSSNPRIISDSVSQPVQKKPKAHVASPAMDARWIDRIARASEHLMSPDVVRRLNQLDARAGDGDTGTTLIRALSSFLKDIRTQSPKTAIDLLELALNTAEKAGGSFGGMLAIFFRGTLSFNDDESFAWGRAWSKGLEYLRASGAAKVGDRSFMDALCPTIDQSQSLAAAARAARQGADSTATLVAKVGRACYVPQARYESYNDAGAEAVALFLERMLQDQ